MPKHILIVEDDLDAGENLQYLLSRRGFKATHVPSRVDAQAFIEKNPSNPPDVAILDMNLGTRDTGADVGQDLLNHYGQRAPELLIYSAYNDRPYLDAATHLSAAIYLQKAHNDSLDTITHVRILAMRRALSRGGNINARQIRDIVAGCQDHTTAFMKVTEAILVPQLDECLGTEVVLLMTSRDGVHSFGHKGDLPQQQACYEQIQAGVARLAPGSYLDTSDFDSPPAGLENFIFFSLYHTNVVQISLGIMDSSGEAGSKRDPARRLVDVFRLHFRDTLVERLFAVTDVLAHEEQQKRKYLEGVVAMCETLGQRQEDICGEAVSNNELDQKSFTYAKFKNLSRGLKLAAEQLELLTEGRPTVVPIDLKPMIEELWHEISQRFAMPEGLLKVKETPRVLANRSDLRMALRRLLRFFANRDQDPKEGIEVFCKDDGPGWTRICFQDTSPRLPGMLRERLFTPFSDGTAGHEHVDDWLGLYAAKMVVELRLGGELIESTDAKPESNGHWFEMRIRKPAAD